MANMATGVLEKLKNISGKFPNSSGVYLFLDKNKKPIYIGRAGSLKKRIASYFRAKDPRIQEMVQSAKGLKFQKTSNLLEAVIFEANLIKKYWPKYNVKEKDNRSFVYLAITSPSTGSGQELPRVLIIRGRDLEKYGAADAKIFGPYQSFRILKVALDLVRKIFPFGKCMPNQGRPCFDYQIGLCPGVCIGAISQKEYKKNIDDIVLFFSGHKKRLLKKLKKNNPEKIKALEYVSDVALLQELEKITGQKREGAYGRIEGYDISHLFGRNAVGAMVVFENGEKNPSQYRLFKIKNLKEGGNYNDLEMLKEILERRVEHKEWSYPDIVFVDGGLNQVKVAKEVLARNNIFIPVVGLAKTGGHSASAYASDKLIIANSKKSSRELLIASKRIFQAVRNEAHRLAIEFNRRSRFR